MKKVLLVCFAAAISTGSLSSRAAEIRLDRPKPQRTVTPNMVMMEHDPAAGISFASAWRYSNDDTYVYDQTANTITKLRYADVIRAFEFIEYPTSAVPAANLVNFDTTLTGSVTRTSPTNIVVTGSSSIGNGVNGCGQAATQTATYDPVMAPFKDYSTTYYVAELTNGTNDSDCLFLKPSYTGQLDAKPWVTGDPTGPAVYTRAEIAVTKRLVTTSSTLCSPLSDGQRYRGYFTISMKFDSGVESRNGPLGKLTQILNRTTRWGLGNAYAEGGTGFSATTSQVCATSADENCVGNACFSGLSFGLSRPYTYSIRALSNLPITGGQRLHILKGDTASPSGFTAGSGTTVNSTPSYAWSARAGTLENDGTCVATGPDTYNCPDTVAVGNNTYIQELLSRPLADFNRLRVNTNAGVVAFRRSNGIVMMFDAPTRDFVPWAAVNPTTGTNGPAAATDLPISYLSRIPLSSNSSGGGGAITFPVISLNVDPATVYPGQPFNVIWDVAGAASCDATGSLPNFTGGKPYSGTQPYGSGLATTGSYIAKLTCIHADGYAKSKESTLTVIAEPPVTVSMSANPLTLTRGGTTRITWDAGTALRCTATGTLPGWAGSKGVSGSQDITVSAAGTYTAELSCSRYAQSGANSLQITASPYPPIVFNEFRADPNPVTGGESTNVHWATSNASACEGRLVQYPSDSVFDGWVGTKTTTGAQGFTTNKVGTFSLVLRCTNPDNDQSRQLDLPVTAPSPPAVNLRAAPTSITQGGSTTVSFDSQNASRCSAGGDLNGWSGDKPVGGASSNLTVTQGAGVYKPNVTCWNLGGSTTKEVEVTVNPPAGGCTCPSGTTQVDAGHCRNSANQVFDCGAAAAPTASISASPASFFANQNSNICWTCQNSYSTTVAGLPGWGGTKPTNACEVVTVSQTGQYTAQVSCTNSVSTAYASTTVEVRTAPPASITEFRLDRTDVLVGSGSLRAIWNTADAASCVASGMNGWDGNKPTSASSHPVSVPTAGTYTLQLVCYNQSGAASQTATASIRVWNPPRILEYSLTPATAASGQTVESAVYTSDVTACRTTSSSNPFISANQSINPSGNTNLGTKTAGGDYDLAIYCENPAATSAVETRQVRVNHPPVALGAFDVQPREINSGETTGISWSSSNTTSCDGRGTLPGWGNTTRASSGSARSSAISNGTPGAATYAASVSCAGPGGTSASNTIQLVVRPAQPTLSVNTSSATIAPGGSFTFTWNANGSARDYQCNRIGNLPGWASGDGQLQSGSANVAAPSTQGSYSVGMRCSNDVGSVERYASVSVTAASCTFYAAVAGTTQTVGDNFCWYFDCGSKDQQPRNVDGGHGDLYVATDPTSSFYNATYNNTAAANTRSMKKTGTIPHGGVGWVTVLWSKQHTGSNDYDNWNSKTRQMSCDNGNLTIGADPGWIDASSWSRTNNKTQDRGDDRYFHIMNDPTIWAAGWCEATSVSWTDDETGYRCSGNIARGANGVTNTASVYSNLRIGSANFRCVDGVRQQVSGGSCQRNTNGGPEP